MKYLIKNKLPLKTLLMPIFIFMMFLLMFFILEKDNNFILYLLFVVVTISIFLFFTKSFKKYNLFAFGLMALWGFILQVLAFRGILQNLYGFTIFYYFLLFFTTLLIFDIKKVNKIAINKSAYLIKLIHKIKVEKDGDYYIDDQKSTLDGRHDIPNGEINMTTFYTFIVVIVVCLPIILFGKFSVALGIVSARYFPNSDFILYGALLFLGTIFFLAGLSLFLTYLKLDFSDKKDR